LPFVIHRDRGEDSLPRYSGTSDRRIVLHTYSTIRRQRGHALPALLAFSPICLSSCLLSLLLTFHLLTSLGVFHFYAPVSSTQGSVAAVQKHESNSSVPTAIPLVSKEQGSRGSSRRTRRIRNHSTPVLLYGICHQRPEQGSSRQLGLVLYMCRAGGVSPGRALLPRPFVLVKCQPARWRHQIDQRPETQPNAHNPQHSLFTEMLVNVRVSARERGCRRVNSLSREGCYQQ